MCFWFTKCHLLLNHIFICFSEMRCGDILRPWIFFHMYIFIFLIRKNCGDVVLLSLLSFFHIWICCFFFLFRKILGEKKNVKMFTFFFFFSLLFFVCEYFSFFLRIGCKGYLCLCIVFYFIILFRKNCGDVVLLSLLSFFLYVNIFYFFFIFFYY